MSRTFKTVQPNKYSSEYTTLLSLKTKCRNKCRVEKKIYNSTELYDGLFTKVDLKDVDVIQYVNNSPLNPFYYNYIIDPNYELKSKCDSNKNRFVVPFPYQQLDNTIIIQ